MIAFGCSIGDPEPYLRYAEPGIHLAAEPDSEIQAFASVGTIGRSYNLLLDHAGVREDLEALVLVHPHAEIVDPQLCEKVRRFFAESDVGVVGAVGATGVRSIAWWEGAVVSGSVTHRYPTHGGGDLPAFSWAQARPAPAEVEIVEGWLLVLSPWVVRNVRFDESLSLGHGFELDLCWQVREAGRKVMVQDLRVIHHHELEQVSNLPLWVEAHVRIGEKWDGQIPGAEAEQEIGWKTRARRAEAERDAARAIANSKRYGYEARLRYIEESLEALTRTTSWRVTEPLRKANMWRRAITSRHGVAGK